MSAEEYGAKSLLKTGLVVGALAGAAYMFASGDSVTVDDSSKKKAKSARAKRKSSKLNELSSSSKRRRAPASRNVANTSAKSTRVLRGSSASGTKSARKNLGGGTTYNDSSASSLYSDSSGSFSSASGIEGSYFDPVINDSGSSDSSSASSSDEGQCFGAGCSNAGDSSGGVGGAVYGSDPAETTPLSDPLPEISTSIATIVDIDSTTTLDGTYFPGDPNLLIEVTFTENVEVLGIPRLVLETGTFDTEATYLSGSGTSILVFSYEIINGDTTIDLGYISSAALVLAGGAVQTLASSLAADLTMPLPGAAGSLSDSKAIVIQDNVAPTITRIESIENNGQFGNSDVLNIIVIFDEAVIIAGGTPEIDIDSTGVNVPMEPHSGSNILEFQYSVGGGDNSLDLAVTSLLNGGATINDASGNAAVLTLPAAGSLLEDTRDLIIDSISPNIVSVDSPTADGIYGIGDVVVIEVKFDEKVLKTAFPDVTTNTDIPIVVQYFGGNSTDTLTFNYTIGVNEDVGDLNITAITAGGGITDLVSNAANLGTLPVGVAPTSLGSNRNIIIDGTIPQILSINAPLDKVYHYDESLDFTVNFSEVVSVTGTPRLKLDIGGALRYANYISGSASTALIFRYIPLAPELDSDGISFNSNDVEFNSGDIFDNAGNSINTDFAGVVPITNNIEVSNWTPSLISNLQLWIDASDYNSIYTNADCTTGQMEFAGGDVGCIKDKSGNGFHMIQANAGTRPSLDLDPVNGLRLDLDTTQNDFLHSNSALGLNNNSNGRTVFIVAELKSSTNRAPLFAMGKNGSVNDFLSLEANTFNSAGSLWGLYSNGNSFDTAEATSTNISAFGYSALQVQGVVGLETTVNVNGVGATFSNRFGADDWGSVGQFASFDNAAIGILPGNSIYSDAYIHEVIVYDKSIHPTELWYLNCYMAKKYNFEASLPVAYCAAAPTPYVTKVRAVTPNGFYETGTMDIEVVFSEPVDIAGGIPFLTIDTGGVTTSYDAGFISGSGTNTLLFQYPIQAGDENADLSYVNTTSLDNNFSTIVSSTSNNTALLTLPPGAPFSLDAQSALAIDTNNPIDNTANVTPALYDNDATDIPVTWVAFTDETLTDHRIELYLADNTCAIAATYSFNTGSAGNTDNGVVDVVADGVYWATVTAIDGLGHETKSACSPTSLTVDTIAPTITDINTTPAADAYYGLGQTFTIEVSFSEIVKISGTPQIVLNSGATVNYTVGAPSAALRFNYTVGAGENSLDLDVVNFIVGTYTRDLAENDLDTTLPAFGGIDDSLLENRDIVIDTVAPTVSHVNRFPGVDGVFRTGDSIDIQVVFTEPVNVTGGTPTLTVDSGAPAINMASYVNETMTFTYNILLGEMSVDLDATVMTGGAGIEDLAGNAAVLTMPSIVAPDDRLAEVRDLRVDTLSPYITNVTSPIADATYYTGDYIPVVASYDQDVKITNGIPYIRMGTTPEQRAYYRRHLPDQGVFHNENLIPTGLGSTNRVVAGDVNNDGYDDILVSDNTNSEVLVMLGNGTVNSFTPLAVMSFTNPRGLLLADFDGDGSLDLVVGSEGTQPQYALGNGDGTFKPAVSFATATRYVEIVSGDLNNDGIADIVMPRGSAANVDIFLGSGDGTFIGPTVIGSSLAQNRGVTLGEYNNDGNLDYIVASGNSNAIRLYTGNGDGTFNASTTLNVTTGARTENVASGDFDNNGNLDVVTLDYTNGAIAAFFGNGDTTFGAEVKLATNSTQSLDVESHDFNGDGFDDIIATNRTGGDLNVYISDGVGGFAAAVVYDISNDAGDITFGDFNNDGLRDYVVNNFTNNNLDIIAQASSELEFGYTVVYQDTAADLNYLSAYALKPNGATVQNDAALAADLLLPVETFSNSLAQNKDIVIDGTDNISHRKIYAPQTPTIADEFGGNGVVISDNFAVVASKLYDGKLKVDIGAVDFYEYDNHKWNHKQKIYNPEGAGAGEEFGSYLALEGSRLVVGARGVNANKGSVYYYEYDGNNWGYKQELDSSGLSVAAEQGHSVAIQGDWLAVGAKSHQDGGNANAGAVVMWKYNGVLWEEKQVLITGDADAGDEFGYRVSIHGNFVAASARFDTAAGANAGALYIFEYAASTWTEKHKFTPSSSGSSGLGLSISGERLAYGADGDFGGKGAVHFYTYNGTNWVFVQTVQSAAGSASEGFGNSLSLYGDVAVIGAPFDTNASGTASGAAYVFKDNGATWFERDKVIPRDSDNNRQFGNFIHINKEQFIVAARRDSTNVSQEGAVYFHSLDINSITGVSTVTPPGTFYHGANIVFDINFENDITVVGGPLQLMLDGGGLATCVYEAPNKLRCSHTVGVGDYSDDLDFLNFDSLLYNGATVTDTASGKVVTLNLPLPGTSGSIGDTTNYFVPAPPNEISNFIGYVIDDSQVYIQWGNGGGSTQGYHISLAVGAVAPADCSAPNLSNYSSTSYTFTGLLPNTQYSFRVCSYNLNYVSTGLTVTMTTDKAIKFKEIAGWSDAQLNAAVRKTLPMVNGKFYAVGNFSARFSAFAPKAVLVDPSNGAMVTSFNPGIGFDGTGINEIAVDPDDSNGYYMAGNFSTFNGIGTNYLVKVNNKGALDLSFDTRGKANNNVTALMPLSDGSGKVYIGGLFTNYDGTGRNRIARLNSNGSLDTTFNPGAGFDGQVHTIIDSPDGTGDIYVGGSFTTYQGVTVNRLVRLNSDGSIDFAFNLGDAPVTAGVSFNGNIGFDNEIRNLKASIDGSFDIYVAGLYTNYRTVAEGRFIKLKDNGDKNATFNTGVGFDASTYAIELDPTDVNTVYVGGGFANYAGAASNRLIKLNFNGTKDASFDNTTGTYNGTVRHILISGSNLYSCGSFTDYAGSGNNRIAKVSKTTNSVDGGFLVGEGFGENCFSIVESGSNILFAGNFGAYGGFPANKIARFNSNGTVDTTFNVGIGPDDGDVYDIALAPDDPNDIYVVGDFTTFNNAGVPAVGILRLNSNGSVDSDTTFNTAAATGFDAPPFRVENVTDGVHILVAGAFTDFDGNTSEHLIKLDNTGSVQAGWDLPGVGFDGNVSEIEVADDGTQHVYLGGDFNNLGGVATGKIVRLDTAGARDATFDGGLAAGFNGIVTSIDSTGDGNGDVFVGGDFTSYNGTTSYNGAVDTVNRITKLLANGTIDTGFTPGAGFDAIVRQVRTTTDGSSDFYAAGDFTNYNANPDAIKGFARVQATGVLKPQFYPGARSYSATVHSVMISRDGSDEVFVSGDFTDYNYEVMQFFSRFEYIP